MDTELTTNIFRFVEKYIRVPEGARTGEPLELLPFQQDIIRQIFNRPTRRAIVSMGRKNGKSCLTAIMVLAFLVGPCARPNSQIFSSALSRDQAALVFSLAAKMIRLNPTLNQMVVVRDSRKELFCGKTGVTYRALSADASTALGLSSCFTIHDELGQVRGPRSELFEALETGMSAYEDPLSIVISTQASTDADLLSALIDNAKNDDRVRLVLYTAPMDADPFDIKTIKMANPALGAFLNTEEVLGLANDARLMPSRESEYRNLILNQRVEANSPFISHDLWASCGAPIKPIAGVPVYCGLDLGAVQDLCAFTAVGKVDGVLQVHARFWLPEAGLAEKARTDRVPYDLWREQGFLTAVPGRSVDYTFVAEDLWTFCKRHDVKKIGFDDWGFSQLRPHLLRAGFTEAYLEERFVKFRQGYKSMSPALRQLEVEILEGRLAHGDNPILEWNARSAVVVRDTADNRKLVKANSTSRIDGLIALTMAIGVMPLETAEPRYQMLVFGGQDRQGWRPIA